MIADLSIELGFPPDAWRRMHPREFGAHLDEISRRREAKERARLDAERRAELEARRSDFRQRMGVTRG